MVICWSRYFAVTQCNDSNNTENEDNRRLFSAICLVNHYKCLTFAGVTMDAGTKKPSIDYLKYNICYV